MTVFFNDVLSLQVDCVTDLATFLQAEVQRTSLRQVAAYTKVSKTAIENIIKARNQGLPEIETLQAIGDAYALPLWKVAQMAGVDLQLPQSASERAARLIALVEQRPTLHALVTRLESRYATDPDFVDGVLLSLEAILNQDRKAEE